MELAKGYVTPDGKRKLDIYHRPDGLYSFEESVVEVEIAPDPDFDPEGTIYWLCTHMSGLFESLEAADAEAKASLPWLRDGTYNRPFKAEREIERCEVCCG